MNAYKFVNISEIEEILKQKITEVQEISLGYTNKIYQINNKYILRICVNERNYNNFCRASKFCQKYYSKIDCPVIIAAKFDENSKSAWQIEERVPGVNLSMRWNKLSEIEKEIVIRNICSSMKKIHAIPIMDVFSENFEVDSWMKKFKSDISKKIEKLVSKGIEYPVFEKINTYMNKYGSVLLDTNYKICHTDLHFDNIMVDEELNTTFLDYDRLRISSIDYELNIISDMCSIPQLILSNISCETLRSEDFNIVLPLIQKYYPELFMFKNMQTRLGIYSLKHYLASFSYVKDKEVVVKILNNIIGNEYENGL